MHLEENSCSNERNKNTLPLSIDTQLLALKIAGSTPLAPKSNQRNHIRCHLIQFLAHPFLKSNCTKKNNTKTVGVQQPLFLFKGDVVPHYFIPPIFPWKSTKLPLMSHDSARSRPFSAWLCDLRCMKKQRRRSWKMNGHVWIPSLKLTARTWKWWFPIGICFSRDLFSGAMLVSGRVCMVCLPIHPPKSRKLAFWRQKVCGV